MDTIIIEGHAVQREDARVTRLQARFAPLPEFRTVRGWANEWDDWGTLLIAENTLKLDWEVFIAISVEKYWTNTWHVILHAVAPDATDPAVLDAAVNLIGVYPEEKATKDRSAVKVEALVTYGATAVLSEFYSRNARSAVLAAMGETVGVVENFALYMDAPMNQLGHTGWDFLRGLVHPIEKEVACEPV